ncbi:conserved membrane hypothetical protein [Paraburkholderia tropica]|nr:conserved membrane hypothetical protein [Paraburkholderia tropica]
MKHPAVEAWLDEIGEALQFDAHYARDVCDEMADHLYECVASGDEFDSRESALNSRAAQTAKADGADKADLADAALDKLFDRFGPPRTLAAQFASTYVFRKMLALLAWVFGVSAGAYMLGLFVGEMSWIGVGLACVCALAVLPVVWRAKRTTTPSQQAYAELCMPMMASTAAVLLLGAALLASAAWKVEHCRSTLCIALDVAAAVVLLLRWAMHRRQTARMCALWRSVSPT